MMFDYIEKQLIKEAIVTVIVVSMAGVGIYYIAHGVHYAGKRVVAYYKHREKCMAKKYRLTFTSDSGKTYSYVDGEFDDGLETGEWVAPFPNDRGNSTAFGLVECFAQSDDSPANFGKIVRVKVEEVK